MRTSGMRERASGVWRMRGRTDYALPMWGLPPKLWLAPTTPSLKLRPSSSWSLWEIHFPLCTWVGWTRLFSGGQNSNPSSASWAWLPKARCWEAKVWVMLLKLPGLEETPLPLRDLEEEVRPLEEGRSGASSPTCLGAQPPRVWGLVIYKKTMLLLDVQTQMCERDWPSPKRPTWADCQVTRWIRNGSQLEERLEGKMLMEQDIP